MKFLSECIVRPPNYRCEDAEALRRILREEKTQEGSKKANMSSALNPTTCRLFHGANSDDLEIKRTSSLRRQLESKR